MTNAGLKSGGNEGSAKGAEWAGSSNRARGVEGRRVNGPDDRASVHRGYNGTLRQYRRSVGYGALTNHGGSLLGHVCLGHKELQARLDMERPVRHRIADSLQVGESEKINVLFGALGAAVRDVPTNPGRTRESRAWALSLRRKGFPSAKSGREIRLNPLPTQVPPKLCSGPRCLRCVSAGPDARIGCGGPPAGAPPGFCATADARTMERSAFTGAS